MNDIPSTPTGASRRTFLHQAAGMVLAPPLLTAMPAFAQDAGLIAAARKEGKGSLYAVTDPTIIQALVARFKEKYGIEIEVTRLISGALGQRLTAEHDSGSPVAGFSYSIDQANTRKTESWASAWGSVPATGATRWLIKKE
jgi:hypothetical protein